MRRIFICVDVKATNIKFNFIIVHIYSWKSDNNICVRLRVNNNYCFFCLNVATKKYCKNVTLKQPYYAVCCVRLIFVTITAPYV